MNLINILNGLKSSLYRTIVPLAIAGTISLTSCYASAVPVQKPVETAPPIQTQTEKNYTIEGIVFHDYNANGNKEEDEPGIPGVKLGAFNSLSVETDAKGAYKIQLPAGITNLYIFNKPVGYNDQSFKYINISKAEYKKISEPLKVEVKENIEKDIGLIQGQFTLPFGPDTKFLGTEQFGIEFYLDRSNKEGYAVDWKGGNKTYDRHNGTDFFMEENTPILAAAPGIVLEFPVPYDVSTRNAVMIQHESPYGNYQSLLTDYVHMNKALVKPGDKVNRGDIIGLSGKSMGDLHNGRHLHFGVLLARTLSPFKFGFTDPYRGNTGDVKTQGFWTKDNDPQYFMTSPK